MANDVRVFSDKCVHTGWGIGRVSGGSRGRSPRLLFACFVCLNRGCCGNIG